MRFINGRNRSGFRRFFQLRNRSLKISNCFTNLVKSRLHSGSEHF